MAHPAGEAAAAWDAGSVGLRLCRDGAGRRGPLAGSSWWGQVAGGQLRCGAGVRGVACWEGAGRKQWLWRSSGQHAAALLHVLLLTYDVLQLLCA